MRCVLARPGITRRIQRKLTPKTKSDEQTRIIKRDTRNNKRRP